MIKVLDWDSIEEEQVNPYMKRKIIHGEHVMISRIRFKDGFVVPLHHHENEQITHVISGTMRFWFDEEKKESLDLKAGETIVIPPNVPHAALMIGDVEEMDTWSPIRKDWLDGTDQYLRTTQE